MRCRVDDGGRAARALRRIGAVLCVASAVAGGAGCPASSPDGPPGPPRPPKAYGPGADGLRALWTDILVAAQRDEREKVHDLMASTMMTDEDLAALFGAARAKELAPRYAPMISRLVNVGAMELVAQITDRKYDDIEVFAVDGKGGDADRATLAALPPGTPLYGVRVKRKGETRGLRYDFYVFRGDRWVTGNLLAKYLVAPSVSAPAATERPPGP